jgi:hypothetical protein
MKGLEKQATKFIGRTTDQDAVRLKITLDVLGDKHGGWEAWRMVVPRTPQWCPQIQVQMRPEHTRHTTRSNSNKRDRDALHGDCLAMHNPPRSIRGSRAIEMQRLRESFH